MMRARRAAGIAARTEAKAAGLTRYFTGCPCPKGHVCERMVVNRDCIDCMAARRRRADPTKRLAKSRETMNRLYRADPARFRARARDYYADHPAYREKVRARTIVSKRRDPLKERARLRLRKAQRKVVPGYFTGADLIEQLNHQGGRCLCGVTFVDDNWTIDHKIPLSRGGTNWPVNIQLLCLQCNLSKGAKTMEEWSPR